MAAAVLLLLASVALFLSWVVVKTVHSVWWKPSHYAEFFKRQGVHGYPYKPLVGNKWEEASMHEKALAKPMAFSHDITPRVEPFLKDAVDKYGIAGRICLTWFGKTPQLILKDPEMVNEVLSNKLGHFSKPLVAAQVKILAWGLANLDGEEWAVQRRCINPVFHLEKLKV
ncbi:Cytochrome P450 72A15 [Nymphaea thermarum]|nr:Cytochrome P450 72A15 [Nymphaea thermarum]